MIWAAFWSVTEPALAISNSCAPMLRPILKVVFPNLFASAKAEYTTQPISGPKSSKNRTAERMDEMDSEFPLTRIQGQLGSGYEGSLNDQSQDGRSQDRPCQTPLSVGGDLKRHSQHSTL
jgi:hypothetical protein